MSDETTYMRGKWICSACGRLNSMSHDEVCPRCMENALEEDAKKIDAMVAERGRQMSPVDMMRECARRLRQEADEVGQALDDGAQTVRRIKDDNELLRRALRLIAFSTYEPIEGARPGTVILTIEEMRHIRELVGAAPLSSQNCVGDKA